MTPTPPRLFGPAPWIAHAACHDEPVATFFPAHGDHHTFARIRRICDTCPVQQDCLETALADPTLEGWWGGKSPRERKELRRARGGVRRKRPPAPHGTNARYMAHWRRGEEPCDACTAAHTLHRQQLKRAAG